MSLLRVRERNYNRIPDLRRQSKVRAAGGYCGGPRAAEPVSATLRSPFLWNPQAFPSPLSALCPVCYILNPPPLSSLIAAFESELIRGSNDHITMTGRIENSLIRNTIKSSSQ